MTLVRSGNIIGAEKSDPDSSADSHMQRKPVAYVLRRLPTGVLSCDARFLNSDIFQNELFGEFYGSRDVSRAWRGFPVRVVSFSSRTWPPILFRLSVC